MRESSTFLLLTNIPLPLRYSDNLNDSLEPFERLFRIIPYGVKELFEWFKEIIRTI